LLVERNGPNPPKYPSIAAAGARRRAEPEIAGALLAKPRGAQHEGGGELTTSALLTFGAA